VLLAVSVFVLSPVGMLCGLATILQVRRHRSVWLLAAAVATLPLNTCICLVICGIIPFELNI